MNKLNKAFTLVELLGVIIIISLLALLTSTAVTKLVKDSKEEISNVQKELIKSSAEMWGSDNLDRISGIDECAYLSVSDLKSLGLLDESEKLDSDIKVKITKSNIDSNEAEYEVNPTDTLGCDYALAYKDDSGANKPKMLEGLVPVIYDESKKSWVIADESKEWYDYDKQWWANAVILKEEAKDKKVGDTLSVPTQESDASSSDVLAMFVWIPRYEYTIKGTYGKGGTSETNPGAIDIRFISKREEKKDGDAKYTENTPSNWYTHPAFTFGSDELSGFWVGKFETSAKVGSECYNNASATTCNNTNQEPYILPNVSSLRNQSVSNQFETAKKFNSSLKNADSHMMKNSEWGAVAYLIQSKYGKYGNNDYTNGNKEVYKNDSKSYYTGRSLGKPSTVNNEYSSNGTCKYDEEGEGRAEGTGSCGEGASTTGNIYGVYDMSGGAWEYVMGNYNYTVMSSSFQSEFLDTESNKKYYDRYTITSTSSCTNGECKGHALSETSGWYSDYAHFVSSTGPWFVRGGGFGDTGSAGVFYFDYGGGGSGSSYSFRVVLAPTT